MFEKACIKCKPLVAVFIKLVKVIFKSLVIIFGNHW